MPRQHFNDASAVTRSARQRGYTLMEVVVSLAIFGIFMFIVAQLTREMTGFERRLPVNFLTHPQLTAVLSRLRRDVLDTTSPYYPADYETYTQSKTTLILYTLQESGYAETVVWDFSIPGEAHRRAYSVGNMTSHWTARGVPALRVTDFPIDQHPDSVRITAKDPSGLLAIDQILQPRTH